MPSDDLILNVRQISQYPPLGVVPPSFSLVLQSAIGGPYYSASAAALVGTALQDAGPLSVGVGTPPADAFGGQIFTDNLVVSVGATHNWNCYFSSSQSEFVAIGAGPSAAAGFSATGFIWGSGQAVQPGLPVAITDWMGLDLAGGLTLFANTVKVARDPAGPMEVATAQWVESVVAGLRADTVRSFMGRQGDVRLWISDIVKAGGAPIFSPRFMGTPMADTPSLRSCSNRLATTAFVHQAIGWQIDCLTKTHPFVFTFNGRSGDIVLTPEDIAGADAAFTDSPAFTGVPTAPTAAALTNSTQIATTAYADSAVATSQNAILTQVQQTYAPINSPAFTGQPTALTAAPGTSTGVLATTAFVMNAVTNATAGVASFNGRTGAVLLEPIDIQDVGGALLNSPAFTGVPTAPTAAVGVNTNQIATCAFVIAEIGGADVGVVTFNGRGGAVILTSADLSSAGGALLASPNLTGVPTAPTAASGTSTNQLATCAFVESAMSSAGVTSFNGRTGAVTLNFTDVSAAGGLANPSPALTGTPTAPTAATATNTTQIATTAFVYAAIAAGSVQTFNGRSGAVTLTSADITNAGGAVLNSPAFTGAPTAPTAAQATNNTQLATTAYVTTKIGGYLPLAGGTVTGTLNVNGGLYAPGGLVQVTPGAAGGPNPIVWLNDGVSNRSAFFFNVSTGATTITDQYSGATIAIAPSGNISINPTGGGTVSTGPISAAGAITAAGAVNYGGGMSWYNSGGYAASNNGVMAPLLRASGNPGFYNFNNVSVVGDIANMAITTSGSSPSGLQFSSTNAQNTVAYFVWVDAGSDVRIKRNIKPTEVDALAAILSIPVRQYDFDQKASDALRRSPTPRSASFYHVPIGLVAQECGGVIPDMDVIVTQPEGHDEALPTDLHAIVLPNAIPHLIRAVQQLEARIRQLETRTLQ